MRKVLRQVQIKDGHTGFVFIPEGDSEGHGKDAVQFEANTPHVTSYVPNNKTVARRCVLDSAISGLLHVGLRRLAYLLSSLSNDASKTANPMEYLGTILRLKMDNADCVRMNYEVLKHQLLKTWNMLLLPNDYILCVLGIQSSNGKTDHAICIADGWSFDSTFEKALIRSAKSLDIDSSSTDRHYKGPGIS